MDMKERSGTGENGSRKRSIGAKGDLDEGIQKLSGIA